MTLDERGRRAGSELDQEMRRRVDPVVALRELNAKRDLRAPLRRRPIPMAVAFAIVVAVVIVLVVVLGTLSSDSPTPSSKTYAFLPSALPRGVQPAARLEGQTGTPSSRSVRGVLYLATRSKHVSISIITARGVTPVTFPNAVEVEIRGYPAQLSTPASALNLDSTVVALNWQEHGFTIEVHGVGLSVDEVMRVARKVQSGNRAQFDKVVTGLPTRSTTIGLQPFSASLDQLLTTGNTLATFRQAEGPGRFVFGTILYEGLRWRCAALINEETATGQTASSDRCVAADTGFAFPTFLDDYPRTSFLIGSFPKSVRSVTITRDNGEQLAATLHDTGSGSRPLLAFVNLGIRPPSAQPDATVTVTDNTGTTIRSERIAT
jgi:hypothetical protein